VPLQGGREESGEKTRVLLMKNDGKDVLGGCWISLLQWWANIYRRRIEQEETARWWPFYGVWTNDIGVRE